MVRTVYAYKSLHGSVALLFLSTVYIYLQVTLVCHTDLRCGCVHIVTNIRCLVGARPKGLRSQGPALSSVYSITV